MAAGCGQREGWVAGSDSWAGQDAAPYPPHTSMGKKKVFQRRVQGAVALA